MARYLTFDCYGTLVDWEGGIHGAFARQARSAGMPAPDRDAVLALHARIEPQVQAEAFRSYRDVLTEVALRSAPRFGLTLDRDAAAFLPESLPGWPVFDDTNAALERLAAAGFTLGILSNVDDELLEGTRRQFTVDFPLVVTAQQVRSYKPAGGHFDAARERIGGAEWIHCAQSWFHDIVPAHGLGIPSAWVNRKHEARTGEAVPDHEVTDMRGLADLLASG